MAVTPKRCPIVEYREIADSYLHKSPSDTIFQNHHQFELQFVENHVFFGMSKN